MIFKMFKLVDYFHTNPNPPKKILEVNKNNKFMMSSTIIKSHDSCRINCISSFLLGINVYTTNTS